MVYTLADPPPMPETDSKEVGCTREVGDMAVKNTNRFRTPITQIGASDRAGSVGAKLGAGRNRSKAVVRKSGHWSLESK